MNLKEVLLEALYPNSVKKIADAIIKNFIYKKIFDEIIDITNLFEKYFPPQDEYIKEVDKIKEYFKTYKVLLKISTSTLTNEAYGERRAVNKSQYIQINLFVMKKYNKLNEEFIYETVKEEVKHALDNIRSSNFWGKITKDKKFQKKIFDNNEYIYLLDDKEIENDISEVIEHIKNGKRFKTVKDLLFFIYKDIKGFEDFYNEGKTDIEINNVLFLLKRKILKRLNKELPRYHINPRILPTLKEHANIDIVKFETRNKYFNY